MLFYIYVHESGIVLDSFSFYEGYQSLLFILMTRTHFGLLVNLNPLLCMKYNRTFADAMKKYKSFIAN